MDNPTQPAPEQAATRPFPEKRDAPGAVTLMFGKPVEVVYESSEPVTIQLTKIGKACGVMLATVRNVRGKQGGVA